MNKAEALGAIHVVDVAKGLFSQRDQQGGQKFVAQGVLQAAKAAGIGLYVFCQVGLGVELFRLLNTE